MPSVLLSGCLLRGMFCDTVKREKKHFTVCHYFLTMAQWNIWRPSSLPCIASNQNYQSILSTQEPVYTNILKWEGMLNSVLSQMMFDKYFVFLASIDSLTFYIFKHSWIRWYPTSKLQLICKERYTFLHPQNLHRGTNYMPNAAQLEVNISGGVWDRGGEGLSWSSWNCGEVGSL